MKKIHAFLIVCVITIFAANCAMATNIGYIDFKKVGSEYNYAKQIYKEIDTKSLELQQFLIDKDKQYKAIDSPIAKKNFEEKTQKEFNDKREALERLQIAKEEDIYNRVVAATKAIANQRKLEAVFDQNAVFVGGADITADVIRYLNSQPASAR